jgi:tRNA(Ile)-lysidine synthase
MLRAEGKLPRDVYVACSGGVDSMAVLAFLMRREVKPQVVYFNHRTDHSEKAEEHVRTFCTKHALNLTIGTILRDRLSRESKEEFWRNERYKFLHGLSLPVITAHNLDDCIETWIFSSLHGEGKMIPYRNRNVIRPFRQTHKAEFIRWCTKNNIPWIEDESNKNILFARNRIRHALMPEVLKINPGISKVIRKKILAESDMHRLSPPL